MSKRPRFDSVDLGSFKATPGKGQPQEAFHDKPLIQAAADLPVVPKPDIKKRAVSMTLYLMPDDHKRLRRLAVDKDAAVQTLLLDAIDRMFDDNGMSPVERWGTRRKIR
ncbi:ribbon-helix-helix domain-containing protein [Neokomagataea anthophila]|uniref:Antitoxin-like ribbon-helix-helix domain-containing protein n=1 Tax=Neokomagataea anthophila TaxID=2826925 RepID=A0ABS5E9V7_9PROT|nr:ribbon-helix-helix domain-containing protein [Neokomagataea anthophila]MBR0560696.1 hypothetical protein [Neokomagataea anthophila]